MEFKPFPKLARLNREIVITEKIDGTNAQVSIVVTMDPFADTYADAVVKRAIPDGFGRWEVMLAGSRTKWVRPVNPLTDPKGVQTDNYGFGQWVKDNAEELFKLGPGQHFGEWWGGKIQRGYGLTEKRFSLFNTGRWAHCGAPLFEGQQEAPGCCHVVPVLYQGPFDQFAIKQTLFDLASKGSVAAPGFMRPEGIVIYHTAANTMFKVTLEGDEKPKSLAA